MIGVNSMIKVGDYFKYCRTNGFTGILDYYFLKVTKASPSKNCTYVILKTLDSKLIKRKLKTRPSGMYYIEHDAFGDGGYRNKFDKVSESELIEYSDFIDLYETNMLAEILEGTVI